MKIKKLKPKYLVLLVFTLIMLVAFIYASQVFHNKLNSGIEQATAANACIVFYNNLKEASRSIKNCNEDSFNNFDFNRSEILFYNSTSSIPENLKKMIPEKFLPQICEKQRVVLSVFQDDQESLWYCHKDKAYKIF